MKTIIWLLIIAFASVLSASAQESGGSRAESAVDALERAWAVAQARNDNAALDLIFDNALVYIEYGKLMTKADYLQRIHKESPSLQQVVMEPMTIRIFGNTAVVVGTYREKDIVDGKSVLQHWRYLDTWVYKARGWVLVAAAAAPMK
jgi:outer membrane lipoprotein-sorting protein